MRRPLKHPRVPLDLLLGVLLGGGALAALAVIGLGLFNVSARDGHWPLVPWVLHTTYVNSVERQAPPAASVPELDDDLVALGAAHFDAACSQCHGAPGRERGATVRAMLPEPPHVVEAVAGWEPEDLFWILKNGVKMSGMPHWPSTVRDDGVWAVVAFLERAEDLTASDYAMLLGAPRGASDDAPSGTSDDAPSGANDDATLAACAVCHGVDGASGGNTHVPRLDLLDETYIAASLAAYRDARRHSGIMRHAAATLADADIARLARHYARPPVVARASADGGPRDGDESRAALLARGRGLATGASGTAARRDVPVCAACHGPWPVPLSRRYPAVSGQHEGFLLAQLRAWKAGTRGGTELARLMHEVVPTLDAGDMRALAAYYASLPPTASAGEAREGTP